MTDVLTITDVAATKLKEFLGPPPHYLSKKNSVVRVVVQGGGCSGYMPQLAVEDADDETYRKATLINGVYIVIDPKSAIFLVGSTLDYVEGLMQSGFSFSMPGAKNKCGCGKSYGV